MPPFCHHNAPGQCYSSKAGVAHRTKQMSDMTSHVSKKSLGWQINASGKVKKEFRSLRKLQIKCTAKAVNTYTPGQKIGLKANLQNIKLFNGLSGK